MCDFPFAGGVLGVSVDSERVVGRNEDLIASNLIRRNIEIRSKEVH